jgi:signal transduction histidine kinase
VCNFRSVLSWRQRLWPLLVGWWLLWCCIPGVILPAHAEPVMTNANTLLLTDDEADQMPGRRLALLEDPKGHLTLDDVRSPEWAARFVMSEKTVPSFGFTPSAWWVWFRVDRQTQQESQWLLEFGYPPMQDIDVHVVRADGRVSHQRGGSALPVAARPFDYHTHVFALDLPAGQVSDVYLRVGGDGSKNIPVRIVRADRFATTASVKLYVFGIYTGVLLGLMLYNLFIWYTIRETAYLYYIGFLFSFMMFVLGLHGMVQQGVQLSVPWFANRILPMFMGLSGIFGMMFAAAFLGVHRMPRWWQWGQRIMVAWAAVTVMAPVVASYHLSIVSGTVMGAASSVMLLAGAVVAVVNGNREARYFLFAWMTLIVGMIVNPLRLFGVLPTNLFTEYVMLWGSAAEAILLSVALAARIKNMKEERQSTLLQLARQEQLATLGVISTGIAQQFGSPHRRVMEGLARSNAGYEALEAQLRELGDTAMAARTRTALADLRHGLDEATDGAGHIESIARQIRVGGGEDTEWVAALNAASVIREAVDVVSRQFPASVRMDVTEVSDGPVIEGRATQIRQALMNVLINACQASETVQKQRGERDPLAVRLSTVCDGGLLRINVTDRGPGMSREMQRRILELNDASAGLGLGVCKRILEIHQGRLEISSVQAVGTTVVLILPLQQPGVDE